MPKPLGMTANLKTVLPDKWQDLLWDAIQEAQAAGITPEQFKKEVKSAWVDAMKREIDFAERTLQRW